jgi:hypothetical protein
MKRTRFTLLVGGLMATIFVITGCTTDRDGFLTSEQLLTGQGPDQALSSDFGSAVGQLEPFDREKLAQGEKEWDERVYSLAK